MHVPEEPGVNTRSRMQQLVSYCYLTVKKGSRYLPPVVRFFCGLLLMAGGVLGFLPVLGFWMFPLGVALLLTDIPPARRAFTRKMRASRFRRARKHANAAEARQTEIRVKNQLSE